MHMGAVDGARADKENNSKTPNAKLAHSLDRTELRLYRQEGSSGSLPRQAVDYVRCLHKQTLKQTHN